MKQTKLLLFTLMFVLLASMVSAVVNVNNTIIVYFPANLSTVANTTNSLNFTLNGTGGNVSIQTWNTSNPMNVSWVHDGGNTTQFNFKAYNASATLNNGLIHYWALSTTDLTDRVGGATLTNNSGTDTIAGKNPTGSTNIYSNGNAERLENTTFIGMAHNLTIAFWFYKHDYSGTATAQWLNSHSNVEVDNGLQWYGWEVDADTNQFGIFDEGVGRKSVNVDFVANTWEFYVINMSNTAITVFKNGNLIGSNTGTRGIHDGAVVTLQFGNLAGETYPQDISFDEVGMWNRSLTTSEITSLYNSNVGKFYNIQFLNYLDTINLSNGQYYYNISAWDSALNNNTGNYYTFTVGDSVVSSTFVSASPSDLSSLNLFNSPNGTLTLNYNVTNTTTLSDVELFYHSGQNTSCWIWYNQSCQSGTGYASYNLTNLGSASGVYQKVLYDNQVLPGSYTMSEVYMENTTHSTYQLTGQARFSRSYFYNLSNNANYGIFENMVVQASGSQPLSTYYCNSSYSTGSPPLSSNCVLIYDVPVNATYNHTHSGGLSKHILVPLSIVNGKVGTITATSTAQILTRGGSTSTWNLSYVNSSSCPGGVSQLSTNTGASWTNLSDGYGCWDQHIHQYYGNDSFCSYVQATMTDGTAANSTVRCDTFDIQVLPPNSPTITNITTPTNQPIWINYTNCTTSYGSITYYNISVYFGSTLFYSRNNSLNNSYLYTPAMDGTFTARVTCFDNNSLSSSATSDEFTYDTTGPILVPIAPGNNSIFNTTGVDLSITFSVISDGDYTNCTFWSNYTNSSATNLITGVNDLIGGLNYPVNASYEWYINCSDDLGNLGFTLPYNFYVNQTFASGNTTLNVSQLPGDWYSPNTCNNCTLVSMFFLLAVAMCIAILGFIIRVPILVMLAGLCFVILGFIIAFAVSILFGIMVSVTGVILFIAATMAI